MTLSISLHFDTQRLMQAIIPEPVFLPRDARSAKRGIAIVSRPSVCLSVRPFVCNADVSI